MKCRILFPGKNKKKHFKMSSTEFFTQRLMRLDTRSLAQPFEEWWKGHVVLPLSVRLRPRPALAICVNFFQAGASVSFAHIFSFQMLHIPPHLID